MASERRRVSAWRREAVSLADRMRCRAGISTCTASLRSAGGNRIADLDLGALIGADLAGRFAVTRRYGKWAGYGRLWTHRLTINGLIRAAAAA